MLVYEIGSRTEQGSFVRNRFIDKGKVPRILYQNQVGGNVDQHWSCYDYEVNSLDEAITELTPKKAGFYMDLDGDPMEVTLASAEADAISGWLVKYKVPHKVYFSGCKGFHVVCAEEPFLLEGKADPLLHKKFRKLAERLKFELSLDMVDFQVYSPRSMMRIPDTVNSKSGQLKDLCYEVDGEKGADVVDFWEISAMVELEEHNRTHEKKTIPTIKQPLEPFAIRILESEPYPGTRNQTAYTLALYLKGKGYSPEDTMELLKSTKFELPEIEYRGIVKSAYTSDKQFGLRNNDVAIEHMTIDERISYGVDDITAMMQPWAEVVRNTKTQVSARQKKLFTYGITALDNYLGMIQTGEMVLIGGVSGIGKSEFVWNIAKANAANGEPVGFIGLEMGPEQYALRMVRNKIEIDPAKFKMMNLEPDEEKDLSGALEGLEENKLPLYFFNPKYKLDAASLEKLIAEGVKKFGIRLWPIDHLHYFPNTTSSGGDATQAVAQIATAIKQITIKYDVAIPLVSHYRKLPNGVKASLNSFKDSISVPQVADTVLTLDRQLYASSEREQSAVEIAILKSRFGMPTARFNVFFDRKTGKYDSVPGHMTGVETMQMD